MPPSQILKVSSPGHCPVDGRAQSNKPRTKFINFSAPWKALREAYRNLSAQYPHAPALSVAAAQIAGRAGLSDRAGLPVEGLLVHEVLEALGVFTYNLVMLTFIN